ncbi:MAG: prolipoprotein diacylglyceryl transferase [Planctomycetes bacterium]|nr:prolipoprotein diacylglyceryl transferase [Planctomycetota bacterium]
MHPTLFNLFGGFEIKSYGFALMVGFLSAVWLAMRRGARTKVDPDRVLDVSFLCLIFGVLGARLFYVIHYWTPQFVDAPNKFLAIIDIREGGLEFLGGFLGAAIAVTGYGFIRRQSLRLFLDILAPSAMWGLAFGRVGCFLNGCCFGGLAVQPNTHQAAYPWAVQFPFASPAHWKEWEDRQVALPAELINVDRNVLQPTPLPDKALNMPYEKREKITRELADLSERYKKALTDNPKADETKKLAAAFEAAQKNLQNNQSELLLLARAERFPSRVEPSRQTSASEIERLAAQSRSLPIHPAQLYATIGAFLLSGLLSAIYYRRKRHGVVIAALFLLYPIQRFFEELIRVDNPLDSAGLTVSQFIGVAMFATGLVMMFILYRHLPEKSPCAAAARVVQN